MKLFSIVFLFIVQCIAFAQYANLHPTVSDSIKNKTHQSNPILADVVGVKDWEKVIIQNENFPVQNLKLIGSISGESLGESLQSNINLQNSLRIQCAMLGGNVLLISNTINPKRGPKKIQYASVYSSKIPFIKDIKAGEYEVKSIYEYFKTEANRNIPKKLNQTVKTVLLDANNIIVKPDSTTITVKVRLYGMDEVMPEYTVIYADNEKLVLAAQIKRSSRILYYNIYLKLQL